MAEGYDTLTLHDLLAQARDALRGAETDHYRRSHDPETTNTDQVRQLEERKERWKSEIARLEAKIAEQEPPPDEVPVE